MKIVLTEALHARPASLLVRRASQSPDDVAIAKGTCRVDAKSILDVLALGAVCGDEIEIVASGATADETERALVELVSRRFDADLVPETGAAAVEGIAVGRAVVLARREARATPARDRDAERARAGAALADAEREIEALMSALPDAEAALFAPEIPIVRALAPRLAARIDGGASAEEALAAESTGDAVAATDLVADALARIGAALGGEGDARRVAAAIARVAGDDALVLVAEELSPSIVASLPARVVGVVACDAARGRASHAAILARGRGLPLAFVEEHVVASVGEGERIVVDTTAGARVWIAPSDALVEDARRRAATPARDDARVPLDHLGAAVRANIGSLYERVPAAADGVGLLRTELVFADRAACPTEREQAAAIAAVARRAAGLPVTVRLFDAGGDKPLAWLPPPPDAPDARGVALLFAHPSTLDAQLRAIAAAHRAGAHVRVLLPLTRSARDVDDVRARAGGVPVGAMIETPEAVDDAAAISAAADFVCIGTNDLAALALGVDRARGGIALGAPLFALVERVVVAAHAAGRDVTVCGEVAADEAAAIALVGAGVDALSVAPSRVGPVRRALAAASREQCAAAAQALRSRA